MKALILAAGKGTRMGALTDNIPKPLIEINKKPFLGFILENLSRAGINEIGIVVGYKKERIIDFLKDRKPKPTFIEQKVQLGTGHAVRAAEEWANGKNFIVLMSDNLYSPADIKNISREDSFCYVAGCEHSTPEKFGVLMTDGEFLGRIIEKPSNPPGNLINTGLYKFTPEIFGAIGRVKKSERGEYEITDAINLLCKTQKVRFIKLYDYWLNLGCPGDIQKLEKFVSTQKQYFIN